MNDLTLYWSSAATALLNRSLALAARLSDHFATATVVHWEFLSDLTITLNHVSLDCVHWIHFDRNRLTRKRIDDLLATAIDLLDASATGTSVAAVSASDRSVALERDWIGRIGRDT